MMLSMLHRSRSLIRALRLLCLFGMVVAAPRWAVAQEPETQETEVWVRGRVLFPDGSPAKGAVVNLTTHHDGEGASGWSVVQTAPVEAGKTGGFAISYVPGPGYRCTMRAQVQGHEPIRWEWSQHPTEGPKTLPARRFPEPCFVTGSIVGPNGELLTDGWRVTAHAEGEFIFAGRRTGTFITPDPVTGEFRVGPLAPGEVRIIGRLGTRAKTKTVTVRVRAGEPAQVVLPYDGPILESSISVKVQSARFSGLGLAGPFSASSTAAAPLDEGRSYLFLLNPDGSILKEAVRQKYDLGGQWWFLDVPRGEYAAELRHPCFEPVRLEGLIPGGEHTLAVRGSARLELEVQSSQGVLLDEYELSIRYLREDMPTRSYEMLAAGKPAPAGGLFEGVVPGDVALYVKSAEGERVVVELGRLEPGETRQVNAQLAASLPMEVLVIDADGNPVEGLEVFAELGTIEELEEVERKAQIGQRVRAQFSPMETYGAFRSDAEGRVTVKTAVPGQWTVRAVASEYADATRTLDHPLPEGGPVVLQLPVMGRLEGQLISTEGFDWSALDLELWVELEDGTFRWSSWPREDPEIDDSGAFAVDGLPAGSVRLRLQFKRGTPNAAVDADFRSITMERILITGGTQTCELDLRPHLPASCQATVTLDGKPYRGARVLLLSQRRMDRYERRGRVRQVLGSEAITGADGHAEIPGLVGDTPYTAFVIGKDDAWGTAVGLVEGASYGSPFLLEASLELVEREVLVRTTNGEPLPDTEFGWACRLITTDGSKAATNSESKMTLRMPPGAYCLFRTDKRRPALVSFEWLAGEGPLVIEMPERK